MGEFGHERLFAMPHCRARAYEELPAHAGRGFVALGPSKLFPRYDDTTTASSFSSFGPGCSLLTAALAIHYQA